MFNTLAKNRFDEMYKIMEENFPPDERRSYNGQRALMDLENYRVYTIEENGIIKAFFTMWLLDGFVFAEHFAVGKEYQSQGLGTKLINWVMEQFDNPFILEIEPENSSDTAKRRGGFYRRLGFNVNPYYYEQPPYGDGDAIPMHLLSYPDALDEVGFYHYKKIIYKEIYKLEL